MKSCDLLSAVSNSKESRNMVCPENLHIYYHKVRYYLFFDENLLQVSEVWIVMKP
jgi:hypothetical protein